jgi:hypothetical protein
VRKTAFVLLLISGLFTGCGGGSSNSGTGGNGSQLSSISVTPASPSLVVQGTAQFKAMGTFSDGSSKDISSSVVWSSAPSDVASVSSAGLATGLKTGTTTVTATSNGVSSNTTLSVSVPPFFGMITNNINHPWPATFVPVASWRTLGSLIKWADINTADGIYDWSVFDQWMSRAQSGGQDVMFTMFGTPSWASSRGNTCIVQGVPAGCLGTQDNGCSFASENGPGICDPPIDLDCSGSGTDQHFKNFVTALLNHVGPGKIKYWELWNEPNVDVEWNAEADCPGSPLATYQILARMGEDMKTIVSAADPNALFTTPASPEDNQGNPANWLTNYFANTNAAQFSDIITFHGYVNFSNQCPVKCPVPEDFVPLVQSVRNAMATAGQQNKPLFDTEASWGQGSRLDDPDQQAAFLARFYLLHMSAKVDKFYWFGWDQVGTSLFDSTTNGLSKAGTAYDQIYRWTSIVGAPAQNCLASGTQWTCDLSGPSGQAQAIWDTSQTCNAGVCTTLNAPVGSQFKSYLDLDGNKNTISGQTVPIGAKPVLLVTN